MHYVIVFDIHNNKRRRKTVRLLLSYGIRVQYSVFEMQIDRVDLQKLKSGLKRILHKEDSLRIYGLSSNCISIDFGNIPSLKDSDEEFLVI